ncbi:MAG: hypothetical protein JNK08_06075 [Sediminibacterium sp.]|nr:hypothetical protein [Sediminibacterium sp.]
MPNNQFHTAISTHRFNRYLIACNNNRNKAELLYRTNIRLSQELYAIIGLFEVILRNSIDRHYTQIKGEFWLEDAVEPGGFLDGFGCEDSFHNVQEAIFRLQNKYTHDGLIAQHTFGFWVYLFAPKQYAAAGNTLLNAFVNRPYGTKQKDILQNLIRINETRNRVAHYEPICFDHKEISTQKIRKRYRLVIEMLRWLGCDHRKILYRLDRVENTIALIEDIKKYKNGWPVQVRYFFSRINFK